MPFDSCIILYVPGFIKWSASEYGYTEREACDMYLDVDRNMALLGAYAATPHDKWKVVSEKMQRNRRA